MVLVVAAGLLSALFVGVGTDWRNRQYLRGRAQIVSQAIPTAELTSLNGNKDDLLSSSHERIKSRLQSIKDANSDIAYLQIVGKSGERLFSYVDSGPTNTANTVVPGASYAGDASAIEQVFNKPDQAVVNPRGTPVAIAPIVNSDNGNVLGVVVIQMSALSHYSDVVLYAMVPLLISIIPVLGLIRNMRLETKQHELMLLKNQFVSIASHELRSPLTGMLWAVQSLSRSGAARLNLEQLSILGAMYHSTESSLRTVNEILDFSIFERGEAKIQHELTDVSAVIKQVVATLSLSAKEKRLNIEPVGKWPRQVYTSGDVAALKRALMNIFSNAIKYSKDKGSIEITHQPGTNEHIIGIHDHGIGIPPEEKEKVLSGYYRATNATNVEVHGTGLGLMVTQKIVEQHGGRLWLESELNQGTTVFIALPAAAAPPSPLASLPANPVPPVSAGSTPPAPSSPLPDIPSPQPPAQS